MTFLYIFIGGGIGAVMRYFASSKLGGVLHAEFPTGILLVNIIGSLLIGVVAGLVARGTISGNADLQLFLVIGILGGFTTFSAFSLEALNLIQTGKYIYAATYIAASVILSILAAALGLMVTR